MGQCIYPVRRHTVHEGTSVLHCPAAPVLLGLAGKHKAVKGNVTMDTCSLAAEGVLLSSLGSGQPDNPENDSCFIYRHLLLNSHEDTVRLRAIFSVVRERGPPNLCQAKQSTSWI